MVIFVLVYTQKAFMYDFRNFLEISCSFLCKYLFRRSPISRVLLSYSEFNSCPYQLLRSYKRHVENKSKIQQERSSMQEVDYQCQRPTP